MVGLDHSRRPPCVPSWAYRLARFELRGNELVIKPELPVSAYCGMLKGYDLGDIEPEKEPDREFE